MGRLLFLLLLVIAALWWLARRRRLPGDAAPGAAGQASTMQPCAHCGVHVPADEVLQDAQGRRYCSEAHRVAGPR